MEHSSATGSLEEMRRLIERHSLPGRYRTIVDGVKIASESAPTPTMAGMSDPSLTVVARGVKQTLLNGRAFTYRAGEYLVVSVDLPVTGTILTATAEEPFSVVSIALPPALVAELLLESDGLAPVAARRPPGFSGLAVSTATTDLLDPITRILRLLDHPEDIPILGAAYRREIVWRLLQGEQGAVVRQIGLADSSLAQVSRAIRHLRRHSAETVRVEDLAERAGMSLSTFHRHFRQATSMTPIQFQKQLRLQEARALVMTRPHDIAEIGYLVGYESPSQFSREYRRAFGEPPGRDAARLGATMPA
jgi:AraC-like DNA-binding protein